MIEVKSFEEGSDEGAKTNQASAAMKTDDKVPFEETQPELMRSNIETEDNPENTARNIIDLLKKSESQAHREKPAKEGSQ